METTTAPAHTPFEVPIGIRASDLDINGHVRSSMYLEYCEHARWAMLQAGGISPPAFIARGVGPVTLETTVRFRRELTIADSIVVASVFAWGDGKTWNLEQTIRRADGTVSAEVTSVNGLLDLQERRLADAPKEHLRAVLAEPARFGL
jgi:acyl-CoA thioester hydrolase